MSENSKGVPDKTRHDLPGKTDLLQVDYNLAALVCYAPLPPLSLLACGLWLFSEPKSNKFLRFHAIQGLLLFALFAGLSFLNAFVAAFTAIPIIGFIFGLVSLLFGFGLFIGYFGCSILLMIKAHSREQYKLPWLGEIADNKS